MKNKKTVISLVVAFIIGIIVGYNLTMKNIKVVTINEQDKIIEIEIFQQTYVFEQ